jgi:hypothetical protein
MMRYGLSAHDYELISAYLDDQLSKKDHERFEARLKAEPELRKELDEINKTRLMIHNLPHLHAPRNYYIRPIAVPVRATLKLAPVFGVVSAIATILLVAVIFGSTLFRSNGPVAMAPAAPAIQPQQTIQQQAAPQAERSSPVIEPTTQAPPTMLLGGALPQASPTEPPGPTEPAQTQAPTPTTIYLYAYPPTSTPPVGVTISGEQGEATSEQCEVYYSGNAYPTSGLSTYCPTPTASQTPTPTETPTSMAEIQEFQGASATPTDTATSTATATETPTDTPSPVPTSTPAPTSTETATEAPLAGVKAMPPSETGSTEGPSASSESSDTGLAAPATQPQPLSSSASPHNTFVDYLLLTVEISLASIAVIAGVIAVILRFRVGR